MGTKVFDNALDLITFSRASGGTALRPVSYGDELVTNGTFDTDSDWTLAADATISGGTLNIASTSVSRASQPEVFVPGKIYQVTFDIVGTSGSRYFTVESIAVIGGTLNRDTITTAIAENGSYEFIYAAPYSDFRVVAGSGAGTFSIDNVSVKEVLFDQPDGTLTLFNHPEDIPRIDYSPDGTAKGLLIEEQRTNLLTQSVTLSSWATNNKAVVTDSGTSPAGLNDATLIYPSPTGTGNSVSLQVPSAIDNTNYTFSVYAKSSGFSWLKLVAETKSGSFVRAWFNVLTGETGLVESGGTSEIQDAGNGWYRCVLTVDSLSGAATFESFLACTNADNSNASTASGTDGLLIYGAQLEAGAFPTSYIPTSGATATRAADVASIPVSAFGYNQKSGTLLIEAETASTAQSNHADLRIKSSNGGYAVIGSGSRVGNFAAGSYAVYASQTSVLMKIDSVITEKQAYKAAYVLKENDAAVCVDGSSVVTDTATTFAAFPASVFEIGKGDNYLNGHIKSIKYFPRKLTAAQLQELTS